MQHRNRVVAILGSPRRGGNSDTLACEFLRGASSKGYQHKLIIPTDIGASPCDGNNRCFKDGRCVLMDGMNEIYEDVLSAKYLLVATPVYFMGPPGSLKSFMDRFQAVWTRWAILKTFDPDSESRRADHKAFAILVGATRDKPSMYHPTISIIKAFLHVTGFAYAGQIIAPGLDRMGDAQKREGLLREVFEAGRDFVA